LVEAAPAALAIPVRWQQRIEESQQKPGHGAGQRTNQQQHMERYAALILLLCF
jgi:hypothetical protein